ncbi:hypothetical protein AMAG_16055 [Allomyces macrogynus ATCC 38327]|uniref:Transmembrane protein 14C n=1 Tax=Allomyces macrogynus (strain ATCC 38327) TaxID=578462 RepID=A0A0L0TB03_ALLM3|nr:hypothetical protein AMAG_16055 [Allomyces macrogynus ATCC 38327]|eukprot:KNE71749.1 hypothetical protein AMAG_16055 [Allomyces macrogynus ATCC 38327]
MAKKSTKQGRPRAESATDDAPAPAEIATTTPNPETTSLENHPLQFTSTLTPHFDMFAYSYAAMVLVGGIAGYLMAGSVMSLAMGVPMGLLLFYAAHVVSKDPLRAWLMLACAGIMTATMSARFYKTWVFFPAGWMTMTSSMIALRYLERVVYAAHVASERAKKEKNK